jgi:hypothetical protein
MASGRLSRDAPFVNKRPLSVTIISFVLIATGALGLVFHLNDFTAQHPIQYDVVWVSLVRLLAIVCGVYMLRASNWARWLSLAWIAFHVVISLFHSRFQLGVHILICAAFAYFLFRPRTSEYFRGAAA